MTEIKYYVKVYMKDLNTSPNFRIIPFIDFIEVMIKVGDYTKLSIDQPVECFDIIMSISALGAYCDSTPEPDMVRNMENMFQFELIKVTITDTGNISMELVRVFYPGIVKQEFDNAKKELKF